jgi:pyrroline-5-carboxylate reductase
LPKVWLKLPGRRFRKDVCLAASLGGTTIEGLHELEKGKTRGVLMSAVRAAIEKSKKLGQGWAIANLFMA